MTACEDDLPTETAVVDVPDLEILEDAVEGLPMAIDPLTNASSNVRMSMVALPGMSISTGSTKMSIRSRGGVAHDSIVVGVPLTTGDGSWNGVSLQPGRAWCYGPGAEHEGVAAHPPWWAGITVDRSLFSTGDQERLFGGPELRIVESVAAERLAALVRDVDAAVCEGRSESLAAVLRSDVVDAIASLVEDAQLTTTTAARLVERCESLAPELGPIPTVRGLADAVGTSDRWVRAAFSQTYGIAPSEYFRARALASCRRELEAARPGSVTVTEVAGRWGFWHLGRFSARYRETFGELPSTSLARE